MSTMPKRDANGKFVSNGTSTKRKKKPTKAASTSNSTPTPKMSAQAIVASVNGKKTPPPAATPKPKNHIAFIVDRSGSMDPVWAPTEKALKGNFNEVRGQSIRTGQDSTVTLTSFGDTVVIDSLGVPIENFTLPGNMRANMGMTALYDAVGLTIEKMAKFKDADDDNVSFMLIILTDGDENHSKQHLYGGSGDKLRNLIKKLQSTDRWSFAFLVPPGSERNITGRLGLPDGNVTAWEASTRGAEVAGVAVQGGIARYYSSRSAGLRSTKDFFVTDMSKVTSRDLSKLTNLHGQLRILEVEKEEAIQPFVESKMGSYRLGSAFYKLTKRETIQPQKQILIMKHREKTVYGGYEARQLLGLPDNQDVRVEPGNHGDYDIFVQSTSVNRKLVRGTKLLVMK
jgi:hypothetical protein